MYFLASAYCTAAIMYWLHYMARHGVVDLIWSFRQLCPQISPSIFFEGHKSDFTVAGNGENEKVQGQAGYMILFGQPAMECGKFCVRHRRDMRYFMALLTDWGARFHGGLHINIQTQSRSVLEHGAHAAHGLTGSVSLRMPNGFQCLLITTCQVSRIW